MAAASDHLENALLDQIFNNTDMGTFPNVFVSLHTTATTDAGGGTEVTGGSYARVSTAPADWNAASGGTIDNSSAITFPQATANWGTVTHFGIWDASSGGNLLVHGALTQSRTVNSGDTFEFAAGALDVTAD